MLLYAIWEANKIGYICDTQGRTWNPLLKVGYYGDVPCWYNNTGRDITFNYILDNKKDDLSSNDSHNVFIYYGDSADAQYNYTRKLAWAYGSSNGNITSVSGTFVLPAGKYLLIYNENNARSWISVWE